MFFRLSYVYIFFSFQFVRSPVIILLLLFTTCVRVLFSYYYFVVVVVVDDDDVVVVVQSIFEIKWHTKPTKLPKVSTRSTQTTRSSTQSE